MPAKKASSKKASTKKAAPAKTARAAIVGAKLQLEFPLTAAKVAAIQECIAKGTLTVSVNKVDLGAARLRGPWLYD
jgi:anti-sigma28 factor (negative regulator of flagellin synthesis)